MEISAFPSSLDGIPVPGTLFVRLTNTVDWQYTGHVSSQADINDMRVNATIEYIRQRSTARIGQLKSSLLRLATAIEHGTGDARGVRGEFIARQQELEELTHPYLELHVWHRYYWYDTHRAECLRGEPDEFARAVKRFRWGEALSSLVGRVVDSIPEDPK